MEIKLPKGWTWKKLELEVSGKQTGNLKRRVSQQIAAVNSVIDKFNYEVQIIPKTMDILSVLEHEKIFLTLKCIDGIQQYILYDADGLVLTEDYKIDSQPFKNCSFSVNELGKITTIFF